MTTVWVLLSLASLAGTAPAVDRSGLGPPEPVFEVFASHEACEVELDKTRTPVVIVGGRWTCVQINSGGPL